MNKLKLSILGASCLLLLSGCGSTPTTKDGEQALVTFEKGKETHNISVDEVYQQLKEKYGLEEVLAMMDTYILEKEFKDYKDTATKSAKSYVDGIKGQYQSEEEFLNALKQGTNYDNVKDYQHYIYISYMQSHAMDEYAKSLVKEKQIENYYEKDAKENIEVYHMLITPKVTQEMDDTKKKEAEDKAKKEVENIIAELGKSKNVLETFKKLAKEKSQDAATASKGGNLGYINEFTLGVNYDELVKAAYALKDGKYSTEVITTELGYHVIYRNATKAKSSLKDLKEDITKKLADGIAAADPAFAVNTIEHYRKLYNFKINDNDLNKQYKKYMNDLINAAKQAQQQQQ